MKLQIAKASKLTTIKVKDATTTYRKITALRTDATFTAGQLIALQAAVAGMDYAVELPSLAEVIRTGINTIAERKTRSKLAATCRPDADAKDGDAWLELEDETDLGDLFADEPEPDDPDDQ